MIQNRTVAAVICLHFGLPFLPYAIRSVAHVVDEVYVMYSPVPNHAARQTSIHHPESREQLVEAAYSIVPQITRWFDYDRWSSEGEQFQAAWPHTTADVIVKLDADEVWSPNLIEEAIRHGIGERAREIRLSLRHYWRSFYRAFPHDPAAPGRVYLREFASGETTYTPYYERDRIHHFGYSLPLDLMRYKMSIHGHAAEFLNPRWFEDVYTANRQHDCHPCGHSYWQTPEDVVPPPFMMDHPYAKLQVIE